MTIAGMEFDLRGICLRVSLPMGMPIVPRVEHVWKCSLFSWTSRTICCKLRLSSLERDWNTVGSHCRVLTWSSVSVAGVRRSAVRGPGISIGGEFPGPIPVHLRHISPTTTAVSRSMPAASVQDQAGPCLICESAVLLHRL
jgi:hypothetical protein